MVGLSGLEPPTLRLSVVRSSQLSYRPMHPIEGVPSKLNTVRQKRLTLGRLLEWLPTCLLRKEVIQPLVLERLPCYDFTPVIGFALGNLFIDQLWAPPTSVV